MVSLVEAHFYGTSSQSSVYGLTSLLTSGNSHKVLVASSKRKVYCIEYSKNQQSVIFSTQEVQFTYIPGGAEIISIDSFNQVCQKHDFVVGITFTKADKHGQSQYFNIYSDWEPNHECDLDNIAQGCLSISLDFIPFHLTHTEVSLDGEKEIVWLLSGSDCQIHLYREDKAQQTYYEEESNFCFPEFEDLPSVVLWMDIKTTSTSRLTALGCQDGTVIVSYLRIHTETEMVSSWRIQHDGPISTVKFFHDADFQNIPSRFSNTSKSEYDPDSINLLVGNTLEISVIYKNILEDGLNLNSQHVLKKSNTYDCVTCSLVADIDMDGNDELILGTFGQQLLIYKWTSDLSSKKASYTLFYQKIFSDPILGLRYIDVTGDGINELLVLTNKGLHIFQHDLKKVTRKCLTRMKWLVQNFSQNEIENFLEIA